MGTAHHLLVKDTFFALCLVTTTLTGCASQPIKSLTSDFWFKKQKTVAILNIPIPKAQQHITGQQGGLFDIVGSLIHESAPTPLKIRLGQLDTAPIESLKHQLTERLTQQGFLVKEINIPPYLDLLPPKEGFSRYNVVKQRLNLEADYVLILNAPSWGILRPCYGLIPLTAPQAHVELKGELVDTKDNRLIWYYQDQINQPIVGKWNQSPYYPNLIHSVEITVEEAKLRLMHNFFRSATLPENIAEIRKSFTNNSTSTN